MSRRSPAASAHTLVRAAFVLAGLCALAAPARAGQPALKESEALARLLARAGEEPLLVLAVTDTWALPQQLSETRLAKLVQDPDYADGRAGLLRLGRESFGADVATLWDDLRPQLAGPAALILRRPPAPAAGGAPAPLRPLLLLTAQDPDAAEAIQRFWPKAGPEALASRVELQTVPRKELAADGAPAEWAKALAERPGQFRVLVRPRAFQAALESAAGADLKRVPSGWQQALARLAECGVERLEWVICIQEGDLAEALRLDLAPEAKSPFARLVRGLRAEPKPWRPLQAALPAPEDLVLLVQADPVALGPDLPGVAGALEGFLRGDKWVRRHGQEAEVLAATRYTFLTDGLTGTLALVSRSAHSGEVQTLVALERAAGGTEAFRTALAAGLGALGAALQTPENAARIGAFAPLATTTKGRLFLPAAVLGFGEGWLWLCSSPAVYQELVAALAPTGNTQAAEAQQGRLNPPPSFRLFGPANDAALLFHANLSKVFMPFYTVWLLSENGPRLGGWHVPGDLLRPPGFFKGKLSPCHVEARRTERGLESLAQGPLPGEVLLPLGLLSHLADGLEARATPAPLPPAPPSSPDAPANPAGHEAPK